MCVGNLLYASSPMVSTNVYAWGTRFLIGLEGGCMYNANLALLSLSGPERRVKYLSWYQSFVGTGLVLGPAISATTSLVALASGGSDDVKVTYAASAMAFWGFCVFVALLVFLPSDDEVRATVDAARGSRATPLSFSSSSEGGEKSSDLLLACFGNFTRIFQRLAWEVGAVLLLARYFHWGPVAAGYALSFYGFAQSVAQYFYGKRRSRSPSKAATVRADVADLRLFEVAELSAILAMFSKSDATHQWRVFFNVAFVLASVVFYVSSCLTSAPLNDLLLLKAAKSSTTPQQFLSPRTLLSMQYGIFLAFFCAPIAARGSFVLGGVSANAVAGLLAFGWALQTLANSTLVGRVETGPVVFVAGLMALTIAWLALDRGVGGTGAANVFSWHPVSMAVAFFLLMTPGSYVYRRDAGFLFDVVGLAREKTRAAHAVYVASAAFFAFVGYACVFVAHYVSGESQIGQGESPSRTAHVALGYVALLWLAVQAGAGVLKNRSQERIFRWHGDSGKYLLLFAYVTATLGFWLRMNYAKHEHWAFAAKLALTGGATVLFGWRLFPPSAYPPYGVDYDENGGDTSSEEDRADSTDPQLPRPHQTNVERGLA